MRPGYRKEDLGRQGQILKIGEEGLSREAQLLRCCREGLSREARPLESGESPSCHGLKMSGDGLCKQILNTIKPRESIGPE